MEDLLEKILSDARYRMEMTMRSDRAFYGYLSDAKKYHQPEASSARGRLIAAYPDDPEKVRRLLGEIIPKIITAEAECRRAIERDKLCLNMKIQTADILVKEYLSEFKGLTRFNDNIGMFLKMVKDNGCRFKVFVTYEEMYEKIPAVANALKEFLNQSPDPK